MPCVALFSVLESLRQVSTSSSEVALTVSIFPELKELRDRLIDARTALNDLGFAPPEEASGVESWARPRRCAGLHRERRAACSSRRCSMGGSPRQEGHH